MHEARGLDVLPQTMARFRAGGDAATADLLLSTVYPVRGRVLPSHRAMARNQACQHVHLTEPVAASTSAASQRLPGCLF